MTDARIPLTILSGFLGSGKTTVLNHLLRQPELVGTVVIINEFGEIGLDHLLIEASEEQLTLLDNGCVCCTVRGDLVATLKALEARRAAGELAQLRRVIIETTGLADPAPIIHTLMTEPELAGRYALAGIAVTVDAVNGLATLARQVEAAKQVAVADRLLITKTDLASPDDVAALDRALDRLSATAERLTVRHGEIAAANILDIVCFERTAAAEEIAEWFDRAVPHEDHAHHQGDCAPGCGHDHHHDHHHHGISSYSFIIEEPVDWSAFVKWLDYVAALKGENLLRMKGIIQVSDEPEQPIVIHGVQHVFHPPRRLKSWPSADRRTRLVFIVRDIPREIFERTLARYAAITSARAATLTAA